MNDKNCRWNIFATLSVCMPILGICGFITIVQIFGGRADGMSVLGFFRLPGEVFWIATIIGTATSMLALARHEPKKTRAWFGLIINGFIAFSLGMVIIYSKFIN
jgi:hypothetical protein